MRNVHFCINTEDMLGYRLRSFVESFSCGGSPRHKVSLVRGPQLVEESVHLTLSK